MNKIPKELGGDRYLCNGNMVDINNAGNYNSGVKVKMSKFWRFKTVKNKIDEEKMKAQKMCFFKWRNCGRKLVQR